MLAFARLQLPLHTAVHHSNGVSNRPTCMLACCRRYHQYKFIVDGEWRHDESQPFMPDPLGNVNNWLFVRKPEGQAAPAAQQG